MGIKPDGGRTQDRPKHSLANQLSIFSPPPRTVTARFDGDTFEVAKDQNRLAAQLTAVRTFLFTTKEWWDLADLETHLGYPQASISARLRDLRKAKFGGYKVSRRRKSDGGGTFEYQATGEKDE